MSALLGNQKIIFLIFFVWNSAPWTLSTLPTVATSLLRGDAKAIKYSRMFNSFGDALWPALWLIPLVDEVSPRGRRDDMPPRRWQFDGGKNRGGSIRVRSPHISGGRWWLSCRQPACL